MMIPCQLSTFSEIICSAFQFHGHLAKKYEWMPEKEQMKSERVENCWYGFEWCILNTQRVWSSNKLKIMKSLCNRWVFVRNPDTSNEIVRFVHEVHPVFAVTLSTFLHMICGWNDDTLPSFNLLRVHFVLLFTFTVILLWKQISKCIENSKLCQNVLEIDDVALNDAYWTQK